MLFKSLSANIENIQTFNNSLVYMLIICAMARWIHGCAYIKSFIKISGFEAITHFPTQTVSLIINSTLIIENNQYFLLEIQLNLVVIRSGFQLYQHDVCVHCGKRVSFYFTSTFSFLVYVQQIIEKRKCINVRQKYRLFFSVNPDQNHPQSVTHAQFVVVNKQKLNYPKVHQNSFNVNNCVTKLGFVDCLDL
ncbi:Hypothetical_protein [Hexamita inflata]|uniref:Hypothetical_protein n=1 Tax=Hexamita inflata TaxID=28002 RepID=A0AA86R1W4_9EUKA|nr:Hypothetical protein HINF_LOCUS51774 [Hexamita inflata]